LFTGNLGLYPSNSLFCSW